jgi:hypothetical protein
MKKDKQNILVKIPSGCEMSLQDLCNKEYLKINNLMHIIEKDFNVSLHDYPELRNEILDISNFIKRIPYYEKEII